jgi:hypothetical protein
MTRLFYNLLYPVELFLVPKLQFGNALVRETLFRYWLRSKVPKTRSFPSLSSGMRMQKADK